MNDCKTRKITAAEYAVEKIDNEGHKILAHFPDNGNGEKEAEEYRQMLVLFDHYGGFEEVERKLKILDKVKYAASFYLNCSYSDTVERIRGLLNVTPQTTVGELKPKDRFYILPTKNSIHCMGRNAGGVFVDNPNDCLVFRETDGYIVRLPKDTSCVKVEDMNNET